MNWRHTHLLVLTLLGLAGCGAPSDSVGPASPEEETLPPTTSGAVALTNLDFRIESAERLFEASRDDSVRGELIELLAQRARFVGSFADYDRADQLSGERLRERPDQRAARLGRASVLAGLHRFEEAHRLLEGDEGSDDRAQAVRLPMLIASRPSEAWVAESQRLLGAEPGFADWVRLAAALAAVGQFAEADRAFLSAAAGYQDVSPFAIAWLQFQRGVMWSERAGDPERGRRLYADAVARLPGYVTANVHLAEIEREAELTQAIERLERIAPVTEDPEPMGLLGELYLELGREEEGRRWVARAHAGYQDLLARHRAAFMDHAAEFYLGPGADAAQALALARDNLELRKTERAYSLAIRAALAASSRADACRWAREVAAGPSSGVELDEDLPAGLEACAP